MLNMMRADIYRILRGKGIYITFAVMVALAVLTIFVVRASIQTGIMIAPEDAEYFNPFLQQEIITGANAAHMALSSMDANIYFFLPLIILVAMSPFSSGAVKNELTIGIGRVTYYLSKWILASVLSVFFMAVYLGLSILFGIIDSGVGYWGSGFAASVLQAFGIQVLFALALISIGMFLSFVIRNTGATIGIYVAFVLVPQMIIGLLSMAFPGALEFMYFDLASQFNIFAQVSGLSGTEIARGFAVGLAYLLIPTIGGITLFKRAEIK